MDRRKAPEIKKEFLDRIREQLNSEEDFQEYLNCVKTPTDNYIRCNTLKISPEELKKKLEEKNWKIEQPFKENPEIMKVASNLEPGELGRSFEHLLGYYYIQELVSMLPILALNPQPGETILDLCSAPGSKTTQAAAKMENTGVIIANELSISRIKILSSNVERCGVTNTIVTRKEGSALCRRLKENEILFDKILVDAPCSGEGTLKSSPRTCVIWSNGLIHSLSRIQKQLIIPAIDLLKEGGELVYSTCTHAPEENEEIIEEAINYFGNKIKIEKIKLPKEIKIRSGIKNWKGKEYSKESEKYCRVYPQDNNTEGFFITKIIKVKNE